MIGTIHIIITSHP